MNNTIAENFLTLVDLMNLLRKKCPWDRKQTAESLRKYILEEAYEVIETIDRKKWNDLEKELGDLLLQVVFQSVIAEESGHFSLASVIESINTKLIERHPHVFADKKISSADDVEKNWEHIKIKNGGRNSLLSGIPQFAPALLVAQRLQERAAHVSFDWEKITDVLEKLTEELNELKAAIQDQNKEHSDEEIGDVLFSMVNLSRFLGISAEDALRNTNLKFTKRFQYIERAFDNDYEKMKQADLKTLDEKWEEAKKKDL